MPTHYVLRINLAVKRSGYMPKKISGLKLIIMKATGWAIIALKSLIKQNSDNW